MMLCVWCAKFGISHRTLKPSVTGCLPLRVHGAFRFHRIVYWYCSEYHTGSGGGCISLRTGQESRRSIHKELTFMLTASCVDFGYVTFLCIYQKLWFPIIVLLGNEDYEYHECAVIHRYTQWYTRCYIFIVIHTFV